MMHNLHLFLPACALALSLIACGRSQIPAAPTQPSLFASQPASTAVLATLQSETSLPATAAAETLQPPNKPEFAVSVIVDTSTQKVTREQAQALINEASTYLKPFSPYGLVMVDYAEDANGGSMSDIATRYLALRSAFPPNGLIIFSNGDGGQAKANGGYGFSVPEGGSFKNQFVSPAAGDSHVYVSVVDYGYKYMACGYGGSDTPQGTLSLPGECRGQAGLSCVSGGGYSICPNAAGNLYTSTPTHEAASMVIHGLLHNFGPNGDQDDYSAPECSARMGYPAGYFDLQESEYYNGLCPYVYEEFTKGYRP
ncbi:MAG TPA: hypothetical protein VMJ64_13035 [Anaerolineales bacterium]|nr:hypothetical protein [Anaerolineales bacterium]